MDLKDIPEDNTNDIDDDFEELEFVSKEDWNKFRARLINTAFNLMRKEPTAQVIKVGMDILERAKVPMFDRSISEDQLIKMLNMDEKQLEEEIMNFDKH